ncbi:PP2C family protein-serine/threonine phosphatase [Gymnodinialimonas ulvae]|uniref:PP2C family protein-serine/threonine phosphatase n=1 Tax=Gymnodinialimonas ulvae TaxID=3126504 RepID=UPI0030A7B977
MSLASGADGAGGIGYDVATALWQGKRPYQEDTLLADFHGGMDRGFAVLADGMGGHAAGDLASRLVVIDAVSHLKFLMHDGTALEKNLQAELNSAIDTANDVLKDRAAEDPHLHGMGATFLATVLFEDRLYWASVGDSPLYLWREGQLRQLNEDHSMAPIIDQMAKSGELTEQEAASHPDRNALTSVLMGRSVKAKDVPKTAMVLDLGDVLIQASDGLQYLDDEQISAVVSDFVHGASSREIADALMGALHDLDDPVQDNTAVLVLQLTERAGDGGGAGAVSKAAVAAEGARAVAPSAEASAGKAAAQARQTVPSGGRRFVVPAVLLGGAALALGLILALPGEKDAPTPDVVQSEPAVPADAAPVVAQEADAVAGPEHVADNPTSDIALDALEDVGTVQATETDAADTVDAPPQSDGLRISTEEGAVSLTDETLSDDAPSDDAQREAAPAERAMTRPDPGAPLSKAGPHNARQEMRGAPWSQAQ